MRIIRGTHDREGYLRIELTPADVSKLHHSGVLAGVEPDGTRITLVTGELTSSRDLHDLSVDGTAAPCRVCGEFLTPSGRTCRRCRLSLEEDRLERESGR